MQKFDERAQTSNFCVLSSLRQEPCAKTPPKKQEKLKKLKHELFKILTRYDLYKIKHKN